MTSKVDMQEEKILKEILIRWFKNSPYPLPSWLTTGFIKGVTDAQLNEILTLITKIRIKDLEEIKVKTSQSQIRESELNTGLLYLDRVLAYLDSKIERLKK